MGVPETHHAKRGNETPYSLGYRAGYAFGRAEALNWASELVKEHDLENRAKRDEDCDACNAYAEHISEIVEDPKWSH